PPWTTAITAPATSPRAIAPFAASSMVDTVTPLTASGGAADGEGRAEAGGGGADVTATVGAEGAEGAGSAGAGGAARVQPRRRRAERARARTGWTTRETRGAF